MLLTTVVLGLSGIMLYILIKPIPSTEKAVQIAYTLENEANGFNPIVPYSEAKQNG